MDNLLKKLRKNSDLFLFGAALLGLADALYLTYEHYNPLVLVCPRWSFIDCAKVVRGPYSTLFNIPLGIYGSLFYFSFFILLFIARIYKEKKILRKTILTISFGAFLFSCYLVIIQIFVIKAICIYCMLSAITSTLIFLASMDKFSEERVFLASSVIGSFYRLFIKKILFLFDAEFVHERILVLGEYLGKVKTVRLLAEYFLKIENPILRQNVGGINFHSPIGLAAGFDYKAKLFRLLPSLGFGFGTIGTITNLPYGGNPKPRLGRLPKSKSLLVNKGFKNDGVESIAKKLSNVRFLYPQGISVGRSNSASIKNYREAIDDIIRSFRILEKYKVKNSFYELNISCPNLIYGKNSDFYNAKRLGELLSAVDSLRLKKPIFVKMPINKSDPEILSMLRIIAKHKIVGVIFGNLQKDRNHPDIDKAEAAKYNIGYFSGKPTWERSNELVKLAYQHFGKKLVIIGCGGVFSASDAYIKIRLGASLVQLVTGLVFEGPQLISEINYGLADLMKRDGYKSIQDVVGVDSGK
jgi:dihydroorotate dehydrogenase subfamily 2